MTWREKHALFHGLWSDAVGTDGYDKHEWKQLELAMFEHAPPGFLAPGSPGSQ